MNNDIIISSVEPEIKEDTNVYVSDNSIDIIVEDVEDKSITIGSNEFTIVADDIYIPSRYEDAPVWMKNQIQAGIDIAKTSMYSSFDSELTSRLSEFATSYVPENQYTMSVISEKLGLDGRINAVLETLDTKVGENEAKIINLNQTFVNLEQSASSMISGISSNFDNFIGTYNSFAGTVASNNATTTQDISILNSRLNDANNNISGSAQAISGLRTYVGVNSNGGVTGTGLLADVKILQKQNDGVINTFTGVYDVMEGVENPNNNTDNDRLLTNVEPYSLWIAQDLANGNIDIRTAHIGDVYIKYNLNENGTKEYIASFKFIRTIPDSTSPYSTDSEGFTWAVIIDQAAQDAYVAALNAWDLADDKRRVYVGLGATNTPTTPYEQGDLWLIDTARTVNGYSAKVGDILRCIESKVAEGATYEQNDWVLASSYSNAIKAEADALDNWKNTTYANTIATIQTQVDKKAETFYQNSVPTGRSTLTNVVANVELDKYIGDLWKNTYVGTVSGYLGNNTEYMYSKIANGAKWDYKWVKMEVPDIVFDTIDTKKSIYTGNSVPVIIAPDELQANDMWITGDNPVAPYVAKSIYVWNGTAWALPLRYTDDQYAINIAEGTTKIDLSDHINSLGWTDDSTVDEFLISTYAKDMLNISNQLDGVAVTYFQATKPYLENAGLSEHSGDVWFNTSNETAFKFVYKTVDASGNTVTPSVWESITNTVILNSLKAASKTKAAADRSIKNFTTTTVPTHPFYVGDTWMEGSSGNIYVCNSNSLSVDTETQRRAKWVIASKYTDDTAVTALQTGLSNGTATIKLTNAYVGTVPLTTYLSSEIDNKVGVYSGITAPVAGQPSGVAANDIYIWFTTQVASGKTYDITRTYKYSGSAWNEITTNDDITNLADLADGKRTVFGGNVVPTGAVERDLWIPSANVSSYIKGEIYQYISGAWSPTTRYTADIQTLTSNVQAQIDSKVDTYYQDTVPFANATNVARKTQAGDYWYCTLTADSYMKGKMYKYVETANGSNWNYTWTETADVTKYAFDIADGKASIFTTSAQPSSYKINDMLIVTTASFSNSTTTFSTGVVLTSNATRTTGFVAADWVKKINDTESLNGFINATYTPMVSSLQNQIDGKIESWYTSSTSDPKTAWTTAEVRLQHNGDMWYQTDTKKSYWYSNTTHSWNLIEDQTAITALANAATAQATADGVVVSFYAIKQDTAPATTSMWLNKSGTKVLKEYKTSWVNVSVQTGDTLMAYDPVTKDMSTYVYNGSGWITNTENGMVAESKAITNLTASLNTTNGEVGGHTTQLSTVDTRIANGVASVETKWAYNSNVNINGVWKKSGFGLSTNYTSGSGTLADPYVSEFWIDASRFKFTNSNQTGQVAPFTIDATGVTPKITFNGNVRFSNVTDVPLSNTNLIAEDWSISNGSTTKYIMNGTTSENVRILDKNHTNESVVLWTCVPDSSGEASGGWNTTSFAINRNKTYRFTVFIKKNSTSGSVYFGCGAYTVTTLNTNTKDANPYFWYGDLPTINEWYLLVGYVYPTGQTGITSHGGIYKCSNAKKVVDISGFNWSNDATTSIHRCYDFYNTDTSSRQWMWNPRVEVIDGEEPSILDLINTTALGSTPDEVVGAINAGNTTTINGGKITTGSITAAQINTTGLIAENINATEIIGKNITGGKITGARIEGAVIMASYLDLNGQLQVLTNYVISVATRNSNPSLYSDAVYMSSTNDYRIPSLSSISEPTVSQNIGNSGNVFNSKIRSYNCANAGHNLKCVKYNPTMNFSSMQLFSLTVTNYTIFAYYGNKRSNEYTIYIAGQHMGNYYLNVEHTTTFNAGAIDGGGGDYWGWGLVMYFNGSRKTSQFTVNNGTFTLTVTPDIPNGDMTSWNFVLNGGSFAPSFTDSNIGLIRITNNGGRTMETSKNGFTISEVANATTTTNSITVNNMV